MKAEGRRREHHGGLALGEGRGSYEYPHLEHVWHHPAGVAERVALPGVVADELLVGGIVKRGAQVAGGEQLPFACHKRKHHGPKG